MTVPPVAAGKKNSNQIENNIFFFLVQDKNDFSDIDEFSGSSNLLSIFLEYCSIIQQFSKSKTSPSIKTFVSTSDI